MKLKSKLIATIVSICAAIAVMGVGVWAATQTFTVNVKNTVSINFANLTGKVTISAVANADKYADGGAEITLAENEIFNSATSVNYTADVEDWTAASLTAPADKDGSKFLSNTYVDATTTKAAVAYTIKYTPNEGAVAENNSVTVKLAGGATIPTVSGATIAVKYYVKAGTDAKWSELTTTGYTANGNEEITVMAICAYTNAAGNSVKTTAADWSFGVVFTAVDHIERSAAGSLTVTAPVDGAVTLG